MISIEDKQALVELGLTKIITLRDKLEYFMRRNFTGKYDEKIISLQNEIDSLESQCEYTDIERMNARKLLNSMYQKNKRLRQRIDLMLDYQKFVYFATFTLNDKSINISKKTLETYLKRVLKANCSIYVANADYGSINERLHFHAIIICNDIENLRKCWTYGFSNYEKVHIVEHSSIKMAKYITKLTNHAMKDSTKPLENKLIYSRDLASNLITTQNWF